MEQNLKQQMKETLEKKKANLERELASFSVKDPKLKYDWDTKFPKTPGGNLEEAADEVEEYSTRLPIEFSLENQLTEVTQALQKIEKGGYGICERCKKDIEQKRLLAFPEGRLCLQCQQKTT